MTFRVSDGPLYHYQLFGLRLASEWELPELVPAAAAGEADVVIHRGRSIAPAPEWEVVPLDDGAILRVGGVADFTVRGGNSVLVEPAADVPDGNVRLFLLGSALGLVLHQRGVLPLHANAIAIGDKAVAFIGESGAGKSTLAGWFHDRGHRVLADDVCAVRFAGDGSAIAWPGIPRLRLWRAAIEASGRTVEGLARSFSGDERVEKYDVPLLAPDLDTRGLPLAAAYLLQRGDRLRITPLSGLPAAEALFAHTYRGGYLESSGSIRDHWASVMTLVARLPLFAVERRWDLATLGEDAEQLREHALATIGLPR